MTDEEPIRTRHLLSAYHKSSWPHSHLGQNCEVVIVNRGRYTFIVVGMDDQVHLAQQEWQDGVFRYTELPIEVFKQVLPRTGRDQRSRFKSSPLSATISAILTRIEDENFDELRRSHDPIVELSVEIIPTLKEVCDKLGISQESLS